MAVLRRGNRSSLKKARMLLLIELSRLRIESFFFPSIPFLPYHGQLRRNPCDGSRVVSNILRIPSRTILSRGTELVVESFLVIDTRRISFNSYVTIHSEVALFLMSECVIFSIKVLLCLYLGSVPHGLL
jgi:hypothetical protein